MIKTIPAEITVQSLKNFVRTEDNLDIDLSGSRTAILNELLEKVNQSIELEKRFVSYVRTLEIAGRKDFYFLKLSRQLTAQELQNVLKKVKAIRLESDKDGIIEPANDGSITYLTISATPDIIKVKAIRKKVISEAAPYANRTDGEYTLKAYIEKEIRHVSYFELHLVTKRLLVGVDVWKQQGQKAKLQDIYADINFIFGPSIEPLLEVEDIRAKSYHLLRNNQDVLTKSLSEQITTQNQSAAFNAELERVNSINKALNAGTVALGSLKTAYYVNDIRDNEVFKAAEKKGISLETKGGEATLFYYSAELNRHEYIKFELWADQARIKFFNDHLTISALQNVFSQLI